jgi:hypothetical protein
VSRQSNFVASSSTATLVQKGTPTACLATQEPWVIDSGATDHMTGNSGLLSNLEHPSNPPNVTLADGSTTNVSGFGTANLNSSLSLYPVLYVPKFPLSLMSVSKLTKLLHCAATFLPTHCTFQYLMMGRKIGGGYEANGLYYLDQCGSLL